MRVSRRRADHVAELVEQLAARAFGARYEERTHVVGSVLDRRAALLATVEHPA